jgi:hypothetical protein
MGVFQNTRQWTKSKNSVVQGEEMITLASRSYPGIQLEEVKKITRITIRKATVLARLKPDTY